MITASTFTSLRKSLSNTVSTLYFTLSFFVFSHVLAPLAHAQTQTWGANCVDGPNNDVPTILGFECLLANVLRVAITIIGLAGFVMLLYGSFRYLVSGGNSKGVDNARNTLTFAIVGLVVALSAFLIVNLIAEFTGVDSILNFTIRAPQP